jgi:hypothetical protein
MAKPRKSSQSQRIKMEPGTRKKTRYVQLAVGIIERTAFAQRSGNGRLAQLGERLPYKQPRSRFTASDATV